MRKKELRSRPKSGPFMGWDGEGYTVNGRHRYVMLCNSAGDSLVNERGLSTLECLEFLVEMGNKHSFTNHCMFGGSYDANMILGDLSYQACLALAKRGSIVWGDWFIKYRPRKFLSIYRLTPKQHYRTAGGKRKLNTIASITLWDTIGFFQTSFVKTIQEWLPTGTSDVPKSEFDFIVKMKEKRSGFGVDQLDEMERYCILECVLLRDVMYKLRDYAKAVGYCPSRWDGAGAMATTMLKKNKVQLYMSSHSEDEYWEHIRTLARYAYFGGRIEMIQYGQANNVWSHDRASAYPYAMRDLPCLAHGRWYHLVGANAYLRIQRNAFAIHHVEYTSSIDQQFYPFPWRSHQTTVYFPRTTEGWYWNPEVVAMQDHHPTKDYKILESYQWIQSCDHKPFAFIDQAYLYRLSLKQAGNPAQVAIKLPMNAAYGKVAQQTGGTQGKPPPFHELCWAGYITSKTRADMYSLAMRNPEACIAFETDGLYTNEPMTGWATDTINTGALGSWDVAHHERIIYTQSGIYFLDSGTGKGYRAKYRGLDPGLLEPQHVIDGWESHTHHIETQATRFRGMMTSVTSPERFTEWKQWIADPRKVALTPQGKRMAMDDQDPWPTINKPLRRTFALGGGCFSKQHQLKWLNGTVKSLEDPWYMTDMEVDESADV